MRAVERSLELLLAAAALLVLAPLLLAIAIWIRFAGRGPVIHAEPRVGRGGVLFAIHKFRTLRTVRASPDDDTGEPAVAAAGDPRITAPGRFLRRWRLDELPQFYDVLVGSMSLVGPRPQKPENLAAIDPASRRRLQSVRPGITGPAAVEFLAEDEALAGVDDPVRAYREVILPAKVRLEIAALEHPSVLRDARLLVTTGLRLFSRRARQRSLRHLRELLAAAGGDSRAG